MDQALPGSQPRQPHQGSANGPNRPQSPSAIASQVSTRTFLSDPEIAGISSKPAANPVSNAKCSDIFVRVQNPTKPDVSEFRSDIDVRVVQPSARKPP